MPLRVLHEDQANIVLEKFIENYFYHIMLNQLLVTFLQFDGYS